MGVHDLLAGPSHRACFPRRDLAVERAREVGLLDPQAAYSAGNYRRDHVVGMDGKVFSSPLRNLETERVDKATGRDAHLDERLQLQAEAVLAWAVAGYADYARRGGLGEPEAVSAATDAYQLDSDPVARFLSDECLTTPHGHVPAGEVYGRWLRWSSEDGAPEMTQTALGRALDRKGYPADKQRGKRIRRGLILAHDGGEES